MVHGELDLLLGDSSSFASNDIVMLTENDREETMGGPDISETKSVTRRYLAAKRLKKVKKPTLDFAHTIQPVLQLLFVGQLQAPERSHCNLFCMNRYKVRPYIHFPSQDVMLTTRGMYVWRTDDRLMLRGVTLLSVLLRLQSLLIITSSFWTDYGLPLTNFMLACEEAKFKVTESCVLKEASKPVQRIPYCTTVVMNSKIIKILN